VAQKYTVGINGQISSIDPVTSSLTAERAKAEALYAKAASINPYQAALIKKNAQGNIMSPGVLQSLSALGVDAGSGVARSIANIDAQTREVRTANQKDVAQQRTKDEFDKTLRGQFWRGVKGSLKGFVTVMSVPFETVNAAYRSVANQVEKRGVVSGIATGLNLNPFISTEEKVNIARGITGQTVAGQVISKSIQDVSKGRFPDIQTGQGFFPSEETGVGHAARQASLDAAKIAVRNSKGKVIGYKPRTAIGDNFAQVVTLGNAESRVGQVISLAADIAASFALDPGMGRAQKIKELRKTAQQERVKGAMDVAAKVEEQAKRLEDSLNATKSARNAAINQADKLKDTKITQLRDELVASKNARLGKNEDAIKASIGVRAAQARYDEIAKFADETTAEVANAKAAVAELSATVKAPNVATRIENAINKQSKQLDEIQAARAEATAAGRIPMYTEDEVSTLIANLDSLKAKLADAKTLAPKATVDTTDELLKAQDNLKSAQERLKEAKDALKASKAQVDERSRTARITARARELATKDTLKKTQAERKLSEVLKDANSTLQDKNIAWVNALKDIANIQDSFERPGLAYEKIAEFLTGGHGTVAVNRLVDMTDWKAIWRKSGGKIDSATARALADATTKDEVVDILAPFIKRGDVAEGALRPGLIERTGERIADRTAFAAPAINVLRGVGARTQSRMTEHKKVAALFEAFNKGTTKTKDFLSREYKTKIRSGSIINIHDREEMLRAAEEFGVATRLDKAVLDNIIDEIANAQSNSVAGYAASVKLMNAVFAKSADKLPEHLQPALKKATTAFQDSIEQMSSYWASRHIAGAELKYVTLNGEQVTLPGPHLSSELLNSTIYLPPTRDILALTSKVNRFKTTAAFTRGADIAINDFWKNLQLVRPAYIIRNIAEEQLRVFGTGHISFYNNPAMAVAMWMGRQEGPGWRRMLNQFDQYRNTVFNESFSTGDDVADLLDETLAQRAKNSYVDLMSVDKAGSFDERAVRVLQFKNVGAVAYGHKRFFDGVANSLRILNSDEMARVVAGADNPSIAKAVAGGMKREDAVVDYFLSGAGRKSLDDFAEATPDNFAALIKTPEGLKQYLYTAKQNGKDISVLGRVTEAAGGNKSLMEMIATGKTSVAGVKYAIPRASREAANSIGNAKAMREGKKVLLAEQEVFAKQLSTTFKNAGNWDGVLMNVPSRNVAFAEGADKRSGLKAVVDAFFDKATEFEKNSTFGPEFRQAYWDAINQIAKSLDADAKAALGATAENSLKPLLLRGKNIGEKHPVWSAFKSSTGDGPLTLQDAHQYADNYARNAVKNLFYNAQEKRLIFHQLRLVGPFMAAWEDTIKRWSQIGIENPLQVYKGVKTLEWLQKPESSAIYQLTDARDIYDPNQGFFFNDPDSGTRQFWVPFAGTVMSKLAGAASGNNYAGAPIAFSASPMSFNFALGAGSILPGVGPGVTIPISLLGTFQQSWVDNLPEGIKNWLFPFGRSDFSSGPLSAVLPANWNRIVGGIVGMEPTYASSFKPVMAYLAAGGNYNLDDPADQARLASEADVFARFVGVMRGLVGLVSPAALISKGLGSDDKGDATTQMALYNDFETILKNNDNDWNKAWFDFLNLYGPSQAFAIISASEGAGPSNWDSYKFVTKNPDVASVYSDVWGYVMPGGGLSTEMYKWNLVNKKKKKLTPTEILQKVNNQRFYAARDALMTKVDAGELDAKQYQEALSILKDSMGGGPVAEFDPNKRGRVLSQLENLTQDERFVDIPSVAGLRDYMYLRQEALNSIGKKTFTGAKNEQAARDWLAAQAVWIVQDNPDFQKMFYGFFANELEGK
jgi:hypothetical protein